MNPAGLISLALISVMALGTHDLMLSSQEQTNSDPLVVAVQPFVQSHSLAGAVMLVANRNSVLDVQTVGFSDVSAKSPMANDALFWIASQTKPITATALMMLVDEGKVHLDDPVAKFLPEFNNLWLKTEKSSDHMLLKRPGHPITVREILSHTSGLRFSSDIEQPTLDLLPIRVAVLSYAATPLEYEPGSKYQYSNAGINTAGRIIEVVSGMPYEKFLSERLFKPLGMKDTTFRPSKTQVGRLAKSYRPNSARTDLEETTIGQLKYPLTDRERYPVPAGGLFSTAGDFCRFCQMILNGGIYKGKRFISEASIHEMTRKQTADSIADSYGLGWGVGGEGKAGHGGAYSTNFNIDKKRGLILIWMVQHAGFPNNGDQAWGEFERAADLRFGAR